VTDSLTGTLAAVADPTRRAVLQRLAHGPATVGQLAGLFPVSRAAVSQHLRVLRDAGLVRPTSANRLSPYELAAEPLLETEAWLRRLVETWAATPSARTTGRRPRSQVPR
jgi:DNA-binding transcriptional ArsR family regulator